MQNEKHTCLSLSPSSKTSSIMVNLGALPPCLLSSSSRSKSRGSNAILLPPWKAEPACDVDGDALSEEVLGVAEWPLEWDQLSSGSCEADGPTRRLERPPPPDDMARSDENQKGGSGTARTGRRTAGGVGGDDEHGGVGRTAAVWCSGRLGASGVPVFVSAASASPGLILNARHPEKLNLRPSLPRPIPAHPSPTLAVDAQIHF